VDPAGLGLPCRLAQLQLRLDRRIQEQAQTLLAHRGQGKAPLAKRSFFLFLTPSPPR